MADMKNVTDFENILSEKYGKKGTEKRDSYDANSLAFRLGVMLKEARIRKASISASFSIAPPLGLEPRTL